MRLFALGKTYLTPGADEAFYRTGELPLTFLARHARGDWGDLDDHDQWANARALADGSRLLSAYHLADQTKIWIITEAAGDNGQRAATTILLPEEY